MKPKITKYIVGHYIQYHVSRDFHVDFTHDDLKSAFESWEHLCKELPKETDVEIRKQITETIVARETVTDTDEELERWRVFDQS